MVITKLEEFEKSKINVYIEDEYAFWVYHKEIEEFNLTLGEEISKALYDTITDTVCQRVKQKALSILKFMDRTEFELRRKLSEAGYTDDMIDKAIAYVSEYGYLNDERLVSVYIRSRMNRKSKLVIKMELLQKGVSSETIENALAEVYSESTEEDAEMTAIKKAIEKKTKSPENLEFDQKQKLVASLYRKGFEIGKIKQILK